MASVLDLHSRRLLASATSEHPDAGLACDAIKMAAAVRGGRAAIDGVIFHTDGGSTYTATIFTTLCRQRPSKAAGACESTICGTPAPR
jgi:putative transposase